jgi:vitamin B12 transporter
VRLHLLALLCALTVLRASLAYADTLQGRVVDPDNLPVPGAKVLVVRGDRIVATFTTDERGTYGPGTIAAGRYEIFVAVAGFRADTRVVVMGAGDARHEVNISLFISIASEYVVVTATHMEQVLTRVTDASTVLDRTDLKALQATSVAEMLRLVPGLHVIASGGAGAPASVLPRGGEPDYTLVLVDGIPMNRFGGELNLAHLSTQNIDRIEVVRGPASAVFGPSALGALVHVVTRRQQKMGIEASIEGGDPRSGRATAAVLGGRGPWTWSGSAERLVTTNNNGRLTSEGSTVANDDYLRESASGQVEWQSTAGRLVRLDGKWGRDERGYPGPWGANPLDVRRGIDVDSRGSNRLAALGFLALFKRASQYQHQLQMSWMSARTNFTNGVFRAEDRTRRALGHYHLEAELPHAVSLTLGSDIEFERADDTLVRGADTTPVPVQRLRSGWFGDARWRAGNRAFVSTGVRLERIARDDVPGDGRAVPPRPTLPLETIWALTPKLAVTWFVRPTAENGWTRVRVSAADGIKMPTTLEVAFTETPGLAPERVRALDATIEHSAFGHRLLLESSVFHNRYRDLIAAVLTPFDRRDRYALSNVTHARAVGLEHAVTLRTLSGITAIATVTWLRATVLDVDRRDAWSQTRFHPGDQLVRRPSVQGSVSLSWSRPSGSVFVRATGRRATPDIEPNFGRTVFLNPGFVTVASGASISIGRNVELFARGENLLNRGYEETLGYPALGRTLTVGVNGRLK